MQSISHNPLNDTEDDQREVAKTAKKVEYLNSENQLIAARALREGSNSQRSFRIRKGYIRSISRGSNVSKVSNLTHDDAKRQAHTIDNAQKTIEHPTDVEDAHNDFDNNSDDFEHINQSPDIKLKSIDIDENFNPQ